MTRWLIALLLVVFVGASHLLDSPSETETARLVELVVIDRAAEHAALKE